MSTCINVCRKGSGLWNKWWLYYLLQISVECSFVIVGVSVRNIQAFQVLQSVFLKVRCDEEFWKHKVPLIVKMLTLFLLISTKIQLLILPLLIEIWGLPTHEFKESGWSKNYPSGLP